MKIAFYSNFLLHHQVPFCNEMYKILGKDFTFVATRQIPKERVDLGYRDLSRLYPYSLNEYESDENKKKAYQLSLDSDIVILGSAPDIYLRARVLSGKITFRYSERYFKRGKWRILDPRVALAHFNGDFRYRRFVNLFMLCAGGYAASDCKFIFSYPNKTFKWGYFTHVKEHDIHEIMANKKRSFPKLLWAGRFIDWKHPEKAIEVTSKLVGNGINVKLDIIGGGPLEKNLRQMVDQYQLNDYISFLGVMPPEKVVENMEKANIFLFTSDRQEGWGAVLNESMSSGCAVVANKAIGAVPFLIKDGENGLIYDGSSKDLYEQVKRLVTDINFCETLGENAYQTLRDEWSPHVAATRLFEFCKELLEGRKKFFEQGPLSKAE